MRFICLLFLLLISGLPARATHIVGGEFQLKHTGGSNYQITLNLYFDNINGNRGAIDPEITVSIFEKTTNIRMANILMSKPQATPVPYTAIACTNASLSTDRIVYTQNITLAENIYNSPNGYYLVWERCCRNGVITNLLAPGAAAQTFYLEFPAVLRNGQPFRNSSPELFPPVSDYACLNELFYYEFAGKDPDGDSLVYDMVTPLNGWTTMIAPLATPLPAPYSLVGWTAGLSTTNQIPGTPTINITPAGGLLTVRPSRLGLFVFGVRCSEYRNRVKIGEVRRDFQILVLSCPTNSKPVIQVRAAGSKTLYQEGTVLQLDALGSRCFQVLMTDSDANENLSVEAKPVNFSLNDPLFSLRTGVVNRDGVKDTLVTTACFQPCFGTAGKTYLLDLIVSDDGCSLPKQDTVRVSFEIPTVPNARPLISSTAPAAVLRPAFGEVLNFSVLGTDADGDVVSMAVKGLNFPAGSQNFTFQTVPGAGRAQGNLNWKIDCQALSQVSYQLQFKARTIVCGRLEEDSLLVEVIPRYTNQGPAMTTAMAGQTIDIHFGAPFTDSVLVRDADGHPLQLTATGQGFNLADYGMTFPPGTGNGEARATFTWQPDCRILDRTEFRVIFTATEETCRPQNPSPIPVTFRIQFEVPAMFNPANIFTPNQDGQNDYFELPNLPADFCASIFADIKIYNRWGKLVYQSRERQFKWDGANASDGVYFYVISYADKQFKGTVTKVR